MCQLCEFVRKRPDSSNPYPTKEKPLIDIVGKFRVKGRWARNEDITLAYDPFDRYAPPIFYWFTKPLSLLPTWRDRLPVGRLYLTAPFDLKSPWPPLILWAAGLSYEQISKQVGKKVGGREIWRLKRRLQETSDPALLDWLTALREAARWPYGPHPTKISYLACVDEPRVKGQGRWDDPREVTLASWKWASVAREDRSVETMLEDAGIGGLGADLLPSFDEGKRQAEAIAERRLSIYELEQAAGYGSPAMVSSNG